MDAKSHKFTPSILKAYDIRGVYNKDFNNVDAYFMGKAYGTFLKELKCKKESLYTISKFISTFEEFFDNVCDETDIKDYMEYNIRMKYEDEIREMNYFFDKGVEINSELKKMMLFIEKNNDVCSYHESR